QKNAKDGISLVQTAEGALTEVHDMLNRMVELATQSANGTYDNETDRAQLQKEMDQLRTEINRIADSSNFNGIKLLDGSMDAEGGVAATDNNFVIPPEGTDMYTNTILHKEGNASDASFKLELHGAEYEAKVGDTLKIEIGDAVGSKAINVEITASNATKSLKELVADALNGATVNGVELKATAATATSANSINFAVDKDNAFQADLNVKLSVTPGDSYDPEVASATVAETTLGITADVAGVTAALASSGGTAIANLTANASLDASKIAAALKNANISASTALTVEANASGGFDLKAGSTVLAHADALASNIAAGASSTLAFGSLGSITLTAGGASVAATAVNAATVTLANASVKPIKASVATAASSAALDAWAAESAVGSAAGKVTIKANSTGTALELYIGDTKMSGATFAVTNGTEVTVTLGGATATVKLDGLAATATAGDLAAALKAGDAALDTGITITAGKPGEIKGTFNEFTTENISNDSSANGQLASTTFELKADMIQDGSYIQIGNAKYTIAVSTDGTNKIDGASSKGGTIYLNKDLLAEGGDKLVDKAGELLSRFSDENVDFTIGYDKGTNRVSVHEKTQVKNGETVAVDHDFSAIEGGNLETMAGFQKLLGFGSAMQKGTGLVLQIGDTADDFNKLKVNIKDMHTAAMGIGDISIADQSSAAEAVKKIKEAINYVSDVRGTLGATQNRLDHTINNLSVMTENIQDAESTIRDTDVAEEMMSYTKNNILIQSAQAMLAQANQVPQGVLQLLQ
ncbi:MAG: hypothetical protein HFF50_10925, partial [Lawsonibacter sp.]|nr:hypothetical protein [Lawsonibacter sp.]